MCVFYVMAVGMFGSVVLVCGYLFMSHYYVNVLCFCFFILFYFIEFCNCEE